MIEQGIEIMERVSLPDDCIPANAHIEINAKSRWCECFALVTFICGVLCSPQI
jgi:hypothetical protein